MTNTYAEILALADKNNMGLSNTIKRDYGIPLDYSSVQETYEKAVIYAATSTLAYVGQPISVGGKLYIIDSVASAEKFTASDSKIYDNFLKEVGSATDGDNASITYANGVLSLYGFTAAAHASLPRIKTITDANGSEISRVLEWAPIDAIVQGDGNTKTVVKAADGSSITVTPTYSRETDTYTYTLDVDLPVLSGYSVTKDTTTDKTVYKLTKDGEQVGSAIEVPNAFDSTQLTERVSAVESDVEDHEERLVGIELFFKDAAKDEGTGEGLKNALDTLVEIQNYITSDGEAAREMLDAIDTNTDAIANINNETTGILAQAKADAQAKTNALATGAVADNAREIATLVETTETLSSKLDVDTSVSDAIQESIAALEFAETGSGSVVKAVSLENGKVSITKGPLVEADLPSISAITNIERDYVHIGTDNKLYTGKDDIIEIILDGGGANAPAAQ